MAKYDDLDNTRIFAVSIASVVLTVLTIMAVQTTYYALKSVADQRKAAQSEYRLANKALSDEREELGLHGVDPVNGNFRIPVDKAMKLIVEEKQQETGT
ncbi:MAG: hypothetical protein AAFP90_04630 [Planctomycetota bacterium]